MNRQSLQIWGFEILIFISFLSLVECKALEEPVTGKSSFWNCLALGRQLSDWLDPVSRC